MLKFDRNSDELIIVLHEIYGINQHMINVCELLAHHNFDVICPDLIDQDRSFEYSQEKLAYGNFMEHVGFANSLQKLKNILVDNEDKYEKVFILGFSIGATIAWLCSEEKSIDGIVGYYGSRIRDYVHINPACPTLLFFPEEEKSFDVLELVSILAQRTFDVYSYKANHGFSDPYSPNYHKEFAQQSLRRTLAFFESNSL